MAADDAPVTRRTSTAGAGEAERRPRPRAATGARDRARSAVNRGAQSPRRRRGARSASWTTTAGLQSTSSLSSCRSDETVIGIVANSATAAASGARRARLRARIINVKDSRNPPSVSEDADERAWRTGRGVRDRSPHIGQS